MMITHLTADTCELRPISPVTTRVRMPNYRLIALLTKAAALTAEEWAHVEAAEAAVDQVE